MKRSILALPFAIGLGLTACQKEETNPVAPEQAGPAAQAPFEKSVLAIKAQNATQEEKLSAIRALAARYNIVKTALPAIRKGQEEGPALVPEAAPLAKAASQIKYLQVKEIHSLFPFALGPTFTLQPNDVVTAWTTRAANSTTDPFIVIFYQNAGPSDASAYTTNIAAWNDDNVGGGTLDASTSWRNTTGVARTVHIMAFAFDTSVSGPATLRVTQNASFSAYAGTMRGQALYSDNLSPTPGAGCTGPFYDRLTLTRNFGGGFLDGVMLVNTRTMRGGVVFESAANTQNLDVQDVMASGYPNSIVRFTLDQNERVYESTKFTATQSHRYSCP